MVGIVLIVVLAVAAQLLLTYRQMLNFARAFSDMRKRGKVVCGRKSGGFNAGAIVMFLVDDGGCIQEGKCLEGVTSFARVKPLPGFEGRLVTNLTREDGPKRGHRNLCRALEDAAHTYQIYTNGEPLPETFSPLRRAGAALQALVPYGLGHSKTKSMQ